METSNTNTEGTQHNGTPALPSSDFSSLQSAAATYRMFGATPVPLFSDLPREDHLIPGRYLFKLIGSRTASEEEPDWQEAEGIGIVTGAGGWHAVVVPPSGVQPVVQRLGIENTNWIAQNGRVFFIYFRTDASRGTLRALSLTLDEAVDPKVLPGLKVKCLGTPMVPLAIPVPPSPKLFHGGVNFGEWEFSGDIPDEPPPYRSFQVRAEVHPAGSQNRPNKHGGSSMSTVAFTPLPDGANLSACPGNEKAGTGSGL